MATVIALSWSEVPRIDWELLDSILLSENEIASAGLHLDLVDDDGLEYGVAVVRLPNDRLAMIGRGLGGPANLWTVGRVRGTDLSVDEIVAALRA